MRINKFIANNSSFSRREVDRLISEKKVKINGKIVEELGKKVNVEKDIIFVNDKEIKVKKKEYYLALNKPKDYICTRSDEHQRQTIMDLLPQIENLKPIGRLDKNTEGLILASTDGEFINKITHPKYECPKEYYVVIEGKISQENISKLTRGIKIEDYKTHPAKVKLLSQNHKESKLTIEIHEGKNRQVRKMFAKVKHPVKYLKRMRVGNIELGDLQIGKYRNLTQQEINAQ